MNILFENYIDKIKDKRIAVIGMGISNRPLIEMLLSRGCSVTACDRSRRESFGEYAEILEARGAELRLGQMYLDNLNFDIIFKTPGIRPDIPQLKEAETRGAEITSEMEAFFEVCPGKIIGVTGSDGKTTTTTVISEMLKSKGYKVRLGGNIGRPLFADAGDMTEDEVAVLELSSFQLMTMQRSADIAVITNLAPNHLDYHRDMDEYVEAKTNIFTRQGTEGILVLNMDNAASLPLKERANGAVRFFSRVKKPENGCFCDGESIYYVIGGRTEKVVDVKDIFIPGVHNIENYMAAFSAVYDMVGSEICRKTAAEFRGVPHRIEFVRKLHGVSYYNDSIASSPSRTMAGLNSFGQKVIMIAGGYDKHIPYDVLGPVIADKVKLLILTGATAPKIKKAALDTGRAPAILETEDFKEAVLLARQNAADGDIVILSPASASFDKFKNFEVRGNTFKDIINGLE